MRTLGEILAARLEEMGADGVTFYDGVTYTSVGVDELRMILIPPFAIPAFRDADGVLQPLPEGWEWDGLKWTLNHDAYVWHEDGWRWSAILVGGYPGKTVGGETEDAISAFAAAEARMK